MQYQLILTTSRVTHSTGMETRGTGDKYQLKLTIKIFSGGGFMPIPFFGLGESHEESHSNNEQEYPTNPTDQNIQQSDAPWANDNSKDPWMSDEEAGVRSPMDDLKGFFGGFGDEDEEDW